jgi:UTP--glucose-1-phosphate uridylyltransferase
MPYRRATKIVRKAVIPAAGLGTRFLPVTRAVPKALLPVLNTPLIHYAVQEAAAAGIRDVALVLGPGMDPVADYFSHRKILEATLRERGYADLLKEQERIAKLVDLTVILQPEPRGLGHAVHLAKGFVGDEAFAVILPDDLILGEPPAIAQLMAVRAKHGGSVLAAREVPREMVSWFGIIDGVRVAAGVVSVKRLVEKPKVEQAPGNLAVVGRYILEPRVFDHLADGKPGAGGEVQLTDAIAAMIGESPLHACTVKGFHADAGTPAGLLHAALHEARKDPALREVVLAAVESWRRESAGA